VFLLLLLAPARAGWIPTDIDAMNRFADAYNRYCEGLHEGRIDVKQWQRVENAWKAVR
jgi:hypothetical protein